MTRRRIWTAALTVAFTASVVFVAASVAYGQEVTLQGMTVEIPIKTILRGDPGDLFLIGEAPSPVGFQCTAELEFTNNEQESEHPGNDILVGPATFTDVENGTFQAAGLTFVSDGANLVFVRLGADGVFSAGFLLEVACNPPTTTTSVATSSTTSPTVTTTSTAPPAPMTTSPPPVGGVDTGGGSCDDGACNDDTPWPWVAVTVAGFALLSGAAFRAWLNHGGTG